jgi:O-antigen ligase
LAVLSFYFLNPPRHWWGMELAEITGPRWQFWLTACLLAGFLLHLDKYRATVGRFKPVIGYLVVLVFAGVLSALLAAASVSEAYHQTLKLVKILIFTYVMVRTTRTWNEMCMLFAVMLLGCGFFGWDAYTSHGGYRVEAIGGPDCDNSNQLAFLLLLVLPVAGVWIIKGRLWMRATALLTAPFILNALILTRSRGAFLGVGVAVGLSILFAPRKYRLLSLAAAAVGVAAFLFLADAQFWDRMQTLPDYSEEPSAMYRMYAWRGAVKAMLAHPLGLGAGNFVLLSRQFAPELPNNLVPHNTWLQTGAEFGFLGLLALVGMNIKVSLMLLRLSRRSEHEGISLAAFTVLLGYCGALTTALFSDRLFGDALYWALGWACILHSLGGQTPAHEGAGGEDGPAMWRPGNGW